MLNPQLQTGVYYLPECSIVGPVIGLAILIKPSILLHFTFLDLFHNISLSAKVTIKASLQCIF